MNIEALVWVRASYRIKPVGLLRHGALFANRAMERLIEAGYMVMRAAWGGSPERVVLARAASYGLDVALPEEEEARAVWAPALVECQSHQRAVP